MTRNQIDYMKSIETARSNRANEEITKQRDATSRELGIASLEEQRRSNLAREDLQRLTLEEQARANLERERISHGTLEEQERANRAREAYNAGQLNLQNQSLRETARHNQATEFFNLTQHRDNLQEMVRSNQAREAENQRHNVAQESISRQQLGLGYTQLEAQRYFNERNIQISARNLALADERERIRLGETTRHNIAQEDETHRSNLAKEAENNRHNVETEFVNAWNAGVNTAGTALSGFGTIMKGVR